MGAIAVQVKRKQTNIRAEGPKENRRSRQTSLETVSGSVDLVDEAGIFRVVRLSFATIKHGWPDEQLLTCCPPFSAGCSGRWRPRTASYGDAWRLDALQVTGTVNWSSTKLRMLEKEKSHCKRFIFQFKKINHFNACFAFFPHNSNRSYLFMPSANCLRRFSKCSSAALLVGYSMRILPALTSWGVKLSI